MSAHRFPSNVERKDLLLKMTAYRVPCSGMNRRPERLIVQGRRLHFGAHVLEDPASAGSVNRIRRAAQPERFTLTELTRTPAQDIKTNYSKNRLENVFIHAGPFNLVPSRLNLVLFWPPTAANGLRLPEEKQTSSTQPRPLKMTF